ncbi:MAG: TerB family tellurite resistance protein [Lachnospiraceae bacterium]|nr:TerB family tellurite resistance protein [Lachnospiraceae bacterium]
MNSVKDIDRDKYIIQAIKAAKANGIVVKEEKDLIDKYCRNAGWIRADKLDDDNISMDELGEYFSGLSRDQKKTIFYDILMIMYADHRFDESECNFVYDLAGCMDIEEGDLNRMLSFYENAS